MNQRALRHAEPVRPRLVSARAAQVKGEHRRTSRGARCRRTPVERKQNVVLVGQPGAGKTHLSIALGIKACERGFDVRFTTVQELAARLRGAHADPSVEEVIQESIAPELVILDELGFTPLDRLLADALYRIIASRYECSSLIDTSNKSFESRGEVIPDPVIASAVPDRLVHHAHIVPIVGDSFRLKDLKQRKQGGPTPEN